MDQLDKDDVMDSATTSRQRLGAGAVDDPMSALDRVTVLTAYRMLASGQYPDLLAVEALVRFPVEPPEGSVVKWTKQLPLRAAPTRTYTYVALRAGDQWYVTGRRSTSMSFVELVEDIADNPCSIAVNWAEIPTPEPSPFEDMTPAEWHAAMWPAATTVEEAPESDG